MSKICPALGIAAECIPDSGRWPPTCQNCGRPLDEAPIQPELYHLLEAATAVWWAYDSYTSAKTLISAADQLIQLNNAMSDLATYLPDYDERTGRLPYDDD